VRAATRCVQRVAARGRFNRHDADESEDTDGRANPPVNGRYQQSPCAVLKVNGFWSWQLDADRFIDRHEGSRAEPKNTS